MSDARGPVVRRSLAGALHRIAGHRIADLPEPRRLQEIADEHGAGEASGLASLWDEIDDELERLSEPGVVVLLLASQEIETARVFATRLPESRIHAFVRAAPDADAIAALPTHVSVHHAERQTTRLELLRELDRPHLMIDASVTPAEKLASLEELRYFLRDGGGYLLANMDLSGADSDDTTPRSKLRRTLQSICLAMATDPARRTSGRSRVDHLTASVARVDIADDHTWLRKRGEHLFKLREWKSTQVLTARHGDSWGRVLEASPPSSFTARGEVHAHGDGPIAPGRRTFRLPSMQLRAYRQPTVSARQVVTWGDYVLPETFRHPHQRVLNTRQLEYVSPSFGRYLPTTAPTRRRRLEGTFFHLDTELPDHFGHITTEVLGRCWGWPLAQQHAAGVRPLVSLLKGRSQMTDFQRQILAALGIDPAGVEYIHPDEAVVVDELLTATPAFENPHHVHPLMTDVWAQLSRGLPACAPPIDADRIFVSRRRTGKRECINTEEVEEYFERAGYAVVYPEDHSYVEQHALFAAAHDIAGFGGSGMFNMMFAPEARVIVVAGDSYDAANEELFAAANGNEIHYVWGRSQVTNTSNRFSLTAFRSNFTIDLSEHAAALDAIVGR